MPAASVKDGSDGPSASPPVSPARRRLASFAVPLLTVFTLLYAVLTELQITVLRPETLLLVAWWLGGGVVLGLVAAFGREPVRVLILSLMVVLWMDVTFSLSSVFDVLAPEARAVAARDRRRVTDLADIRAALERHLRDIGPLPRPGDYGEGVGPVAFWQGWWDVSSQDGNGDGRPFMEFLVDRGMMTAVPVDPLNQAAADGNPTRGEQYVYFVVPPFYDYHGGQCGAPGMSTWMLAITDLEGESQRPPTGVAGSGCACLWRDSPDFFQQFFDYVVCGQFEVP